LIFLGNKGLRDPKDLKATLAQPERQVKREILVAQGAQGAQGAQAAQVEPELPDLVAQPGRPELVFQK
jgi:hypothetical protein